jgi:hypothetical protein
MCHKSSIDEYFEVKHLRNGKVQVLTSGLAQLAALGHAITAHLRSVSACLLIVSALLLLLLLILLVLILLLVLAFVLVLLLACW